MMGHHICEFPINVNPIVLPKASMSAARIWPQIQMASGMGAFSWQEALATPLIHEMDM